jgi:hypothetical protein
MIVVELICLSGLLRYIVEPCSVGILPNTSPDTFRSFSSCVGMAYWTALVSLAQANMLPQFG